MWRPRGGRGWLEKKGRHQSSKPAHDNWNLPGHKNSPAMIHGVGKRLRKRKQEKGGDRDWLKSRTLWKGEGERERLPVKPILFREMGNEGRLASSTQIDRGVVSAAKIRRGDLQKDKYDKNDQIKSGGERIQRMTTHTYNTKGHRPVERRSHYIFRWPQTFFEWSTGEGEYLIHY